MSIQTTFDDPGNADAGEWLSRSQLALLAKRDQQTIDRDIKKHGFEARLTPNGTKTFRVADFVQIGRIAPQDIPNGLTGSQAAEVLRLRNQLDDLHRRNGELAGRLEEIHHQHAVLLAQLDAKDAQIKALDGHLRRMTEMHGRSVR